MSDEIYGKWQLEQSERMARIEGKVDGVSDDVKALTDNVNKSKDKLQEQIDELKEESLHRGGQRTVYATIGAVVSALGLMLGKFVLDMFAKGE